LSNDLLSKRTQGKKKFGVYLEFKDRGGKSAEREGEKVEDCMEGFVYLGSEMTMNNAPSAQRGPF